MKLIIDNASIKEICYSTVVILYHGHSIRFTNASVASIKDGQIIINLNYKRGDLLKCQLTNKNTSLFIIDECFKERIYTFGQDLKDPLFKNQKLNKHQIFTCYFFHLYSLEWIRPATSNEVLEFNELCNANNKYFDEKKFTWKNIWKPMFFQSYYFINELNEIEETINFNTKNNKHRYEINNCFKDYQEAFDRLLYLKDLDKKFCLFK